MKVWAACLAGLLLCLNNAEARVFSFIYIEAGEGNSSGGHAAVQFGDEVYHYQYENTFLRLFKQKAETFRTHYQLLQNRNLHIANVEISEEVYDRLSREFKVRFLAQQQKLNYARAIQQDQALLRALLQVKTAGKFAASDTSTLILRLPGAGLFYQDENVEPDRRSPAACSTGKASAQIIAAIRQKLAIRYGNNYLTERIKAISKEISRLSPLTTQSEAVFHYPFSEQYSDLLNGLLALRVLQNYQPLTGDACFQIKLPAMPVTEQAVQQINRYQQELSGSILSLLESRRPDRGYALFVSLARLIALEQTRQDEQWTFLDDTSQTSAPLTEAKMAIYADYMAQKRKADLANYHQAIAGLAVGSKSDEPTYVAAEIAANRYRQWQLSDYRHVLRYRGEQALPEKSIAIKRFLFSDLSLTELQSALHTQEELGKRLNAEDRARNTYHLLTHNCVSALFAQLDDALAGHSAQALGGYIDPRFNFIPFEAFEAVQANYNVLGIRTLPGYRARKLAELYGEGVDALVYLRESNVFSSSLYNYNPDDAWFVFFTDDSPYLRPVFGAVNTLASASQSMVGLLTWPFDGGVKLKTGAKGFLASLPELAFFNIRKGSYPYALH